MMDQVRFDEKGLVPVIAQDAENLHVLMLAYMNREALEKTLETKLMHYFSRSRQSLWLKGETSGHFQHVKELRYDCDCDTILAFVEQDGAACHTGNRSCFYRAVDPLQELYLVVEGRKENPKEGSYTNALLDGGLDRILKKVGEESAEVIIAAKNGSHDEIIYETADLLYHLCVALVRTNVTWEEVYTALAGRRGRTKSEY